jgi:hypothetical protein
MKVKVATPKLISVLALQMTAAIPRCAASDDGSRKLDQAYRVGSDAEGTGLVGIRLPLDRAALSVALGRDNVVHLALADRASAERVAVPLRRLLNFLGAAPASADSDASGGTEPSAPASMATNRV